MVHPYPTKPAVFGREERAKGVSNAFSKRTAGFPPRIRRVLGGFFGRGFFVVYPGGGGKSVNFGIFCLEIFGFFTSVPKTRK